MRRLFIFILCVILATVSLAQYSSPNNVLAQLGVKGVTDKIYGTNAALYAGYLFKAGTNGTLDITVIPSEVTPHRWYKTAFIDSVNGSDVTNAGTAAYPYKTFVYAADQATNDIVFVFAPGSYTAGSVTNPNLHTLTLIGLSPTNTILSGTLNFNASLLSGTQDITVNLTGIECETVRQYQYGLFNVNLYAGAKVTSQITRLYSTTNSYLTVFADPTAYVASVTPIVSNATVEVMRYLPSGLTAGDITYWDGTNWVLLAAGTTNEVLYGGAMPSWGNSVFVYTNTAIPGDFVPALSNAYNIGSQAMPWSNGWFISLTENAVALSNKYVSIAGGIATNLAVYDSLIVSNAGDTALHVFGDLLVTDSLIGSGLSLDGTADIENPEVWITPYSGATYSSVRLNMGDIRPGSENFGWSWVTDPDADNTHAFGLFDQSTLYPGWGNPILRFDSNQTFNIYWDTFLTNLYVYGTLYGTATNALLLAGRSESDISNSVMAAAQALTNGFPTYPAVTNIASVISTNVTHSVLMNVSNRVVTLEGQTNSYVQKLNGYATNLTVATLLSGPTATATFYALSVTNGGPAIVGLQGSAATNLFSTGSGRSSLFAGGNYGTREMSGGAGGFSTLLGYNNAGAYQYIDGYGALISGHNTGRQDIQNSGATILGANWTAASTQEISSAGVLLGGFNNGGKQTIFTLGDGSILWSYLTSGQQAYLNARGAMLVGGPGTNTHDYSMVFGNGQQSWETNSVSARKYFEDGTSLDAKYPTYPAVTNTATAVAYAAATNVVNSYIAGSGFMYMTEVGVTSVLYHVTSGNQTNKIGEFYTP